MTDPVRYAVRIKASAERDMNSLPLAVLRRIRNALLPLESVPRPRTSKRLQGREGYRLRVGPYRILYTVNDASRTIEVVAVGHRKDVYRR